MHKNMHLAANARNWTDSVKKHIFGQENAEFFVRFLHFRREPATKTAGGEGEGNKMYIKVKFLGLFFNLAH